MAGILGVKEAASGIGKVLTGDLVVFKGQVFRTIERKVSTGTFTRTGRPRMKSEQILVPIELEAHINPLGIALGAGAVGLAALLGVTAWHGISLPSPFGGSIQFIPGLKESVFWRNLATKLAIEASGGTIRESQTGVTVEELIEQEILEEDDTLRATCSLLNREYQKAIRAGKQEAADRFLRQARDLSCNWPSQL